MTGLKGGRINLRNPSLTTSEIEANLPIGENPMRGETEPKETAQQRVQRLRNQAIAAQQQLNYLKLQKEAEGLAEGYVPNFALPTTSQSEFVSVVSGNSGYGNQLMKFNGWNPATLQIELQKLYQSAQNDKFPPPSGTGGFDELDKMVSTPPKACLLYTSPSPRD